MKNKIINLSDRKLVNNEGVKYSSLLEKFLEPFMKDFKRTEFLEDIIEFAIGAWNFGNLKTIIPVEEFEKTIGAAEDSNKDIVLLKKMIEAKAAKFGEFTNFIIEYELEKKSIGDPVLTVITQEQDVYLQNMFDFMEEEMAENDFDGYINRFAIIIKPQQPFIDWLNQLIPEDEITKEDIPTNIYLVNEEIEDLEKWLAKKFDLFFKMELEEWEDNKKEWPQKRNFKLFKSWFNVDVSRDIYDLEKDSIVKI